MDFEGDASDLALQDRLRVHCDTFLPATPFSPRDLGQTPSALCSGLPTGCLYISVKVSGEGEEGEGEWERESQGSDKKARNLAWRAVAWRVGELGASRSLDLSTTNTETN